MRWRPEKAINHPPFSTVSTLLSSWSQVIYHIILIILTHLLVLVQKNYLNFVRQEQAGLAIASQVVPLFFDKFRRLIAFLQGQCVIQAASVFTREKIHPR